MMKIGRVGSFTKSLRQPIKVPKLLSSPHLFKVRTDHPSRFTDSYFEIRHLQFRISLTNYKKVSVFDDVPSAEPNLNARVEVARLLKRPTWRNIEARVA